jgi:hypothetical protein
MRVRVRAGEREMRRAGERESERKGAKESRKMLNRFNENQEMTGV